MVPSDYQLDFVAARLIERLEGTRRSYIGEAERAQHEFRRIAEEQVDAALGEYRELLDDDEVDHHERFLRHEVLETFLPRYLKLATRMNADEERGHGFGAVGGPIGRLVLVGVALVVFLLLMRFIYYPAVWPIVLLDLSVPFWPDIIGAMRRRGYRRELESLVEDMSRIQEQATVYARPEQLSSEDRAGDRVQEPDGSRHRARSTPESTRR